ncbi:DUF1385 domain-containing protein [Halocella sp. SP3-1]|uniref:DUF1385 domain-containing protein n=1 Tax=Halocella sp. SP3-1 TaxID=2382161 RepID=UPI000F765574|nr:DUF1385 domain-containing protein [Halocella sp. SP3-1]AZO93933.1 DUF1385 domain-containing protein [Halocella sp. SP3-1]
MSKTNYGGQAVIEGVMMMGKDKVGIAVRRSPDDIVIEERELKPLDKRFSFLKWPFIRGVVSLFRTLIIGLKALNFSAEQVMEEEGEEIKPLELALSMLLAFSFAILLFVVLPAGIIHFIQGYIDNNIILNLFEGIIKITTFLGYLFIISRFNDIKRVFRYHGAEHKVIFNYESGQELSVKNARKFTTFHPRCGTNFLFIVILLSIFFFSFFGRPPLLQRILYHIMLLPVIAGTSYEIIKLSGKDSVNPFIKLIATPGLWVQRLTTAEPDDSMLEVAILALKTVLPNDERDEENE